MEKIKVVSWAIISSIMSALGILAVPVLLLVGCNIMDYATGLLAAPYRKEQVKSYKSIKGITKKVCMWLLVVVGSFLDMLIRYAASYTTIPFQIPYVVATMVAIWLVVNEIISILENMIDIGVKMPPFLMPLVKYIKHQVEDNAKVKDQKEQEDQNE